MALRAAGTSVVSVLAENSIGYVLASEPDDLVISTQVLQEFYVVVTRKLAHPLDEGREAARQAGLPPRTGRPLPKACLTPTAQWPATTPG